MPSDKYSYKSTYNEDDLMQSLEHSDQGALPALRLGQLEVRLGERRLRLDRPCVLTAGRLYLLMGPSGSGKSSFARALLGFGDLSEPPIACHGDVTITDSSAQSYVLWKGQSYHPATRAQIAFLPQAERLGFLDALSVTDNLSLFSQRPTCDSRTDIERLAVQFHLSPLPERLANASGGERIRLSAIRGLLPRNRSGEMPSVVIADEPTAGLDRKASAAVAELINDLARCGQSVVIVITHEPEEFTDGDLESDLIDARVAQVIECRVDTGSRASGPAATVCKLQLEPWAHRPLGARRGVVLAAETLSYLGAVALSPLAFGWGLLGLHRPFVLLRRVLVDALGPGTQAFSLSGCLLIAGTVAYFIFERIPKPELVEPVLLPEIMTVTGHALVRVVLPLAACSLVTTKLGAAQAARVAAAVRGGLLETLAMAGWRVEAFALVPAVLAQFLAMSVATLLAVVAGVTVAGVVYVSGHDGASLPLTTQLMIDGITQAPHWLRFILFKIGLSSFLGGTIAALCGIVPSRAEDDVAKAVHRTLLWSVLAVIACQCSLIVWEFSPP
jgi:ABC-type lipoprotein export system ATPase subunit